MLLSVLNNTYSTSANKLLQNYINNTTNILLDDEEANGWELHTNNLNFLTNLCRGIVSHDELKAFLSTGILPLLVNTSELEGVEYLQLEDKEVYVIQLQLSWL
jgi:ketopantoate reductase